MTDTPVRYVDLKEHSLRPVRNGIIAAPLDEPPRQGHLHVEGRIEPWTAEVLAVGPDVVTCVPGDVVVINATEIGPFIHLTGDGIVLLVSDGMVRAVVEGAEIKSPPLVEGVSAAALIAAA